MKLKKSEKSFLFMILSTSSLFKLLNHDEINLLLDTADKVAYPKGAVILKQDQFCKGLFIVIEGMVSVWKETSGRRGRLARLGFSRFFGEMSLVDNLRCNADVIAEENAVVIVRAKVVGQRVVRGVDKINASFAVSNGITGVVRAGVFVN